jgi:hypothetical protein
MANKIQTLIIRYILFSNAWPASPPFESLQNFPKISITSALPFVFIQSSLTSVSITGTVRVFVSLTGLDVQTFDATNELGLQLTAIRMSATSLKYTMATSSTKPILLNGFTFCCLTYN